MSRIKRGTHKQIRCRSLKNYLTEEALGRLDFPNYHNLKNINEAYSNFIQKVMEVIDLAASINEKLMKQLTRMV